MERRRILVEDARGADRHLRVTWHPEAGQFNVSTWHGDVCSGAVRVDADHVAPLIALLGDGMADALAAAHASPSPGSAPPGHGQRWRDRVARGLRRVRRAA